MTLTIAATSALILALLVAHTVDAIDKLREHIMSAADTIAAVVAQLDKARLEILARISELQDQVAAGVPSEELDLTALTAAAEALDNIVPDAPADNPA